MTREIFSGRLTRLLVGCSFIVTFSVPTIDCYIQGRAARIDEQSESTFVVR